MAASKECIFVGGFTGEVLIKPLYQNNVHLYQAVKEEECHENSIINHISVCSSAFGGNNEEKITLCCNDNSVKILDLRKMVPDSVLELPFAINASSGIKSDLIVHYHGVVFI